MSQENRDALDAFELLRPTWMGQGRRNGKNSLYGELEISEESRGIVAATFDKRGWRKPADTIGVGFDAHHRKMAAIVAGIIGSSPIIGEVVIDQVEFGTTAPITVPALNPQIVAAIDEFGEEALRLLVDKFCLYIAVLADAVKPAWEEIRYRDPDLIKRILESRFDYPASVMIAVEVGVLRSFAQKHRLEAASVAAYDSTDFVELDDVGEAVLAAKKDEFVADGGSVSRRLVDTTAMAHYVCSGCVPGHLKSAVTATSFSQSDMCCYCGKLKQVAPIIDTNSDRPTCEHVGDLAMHALHHETVSSPARQPAMSRADLLKALADASGRNVHEVINTDNEEVFSRVVALAVVGDSDVRNSLVLATTLAANEAEFDRLSGSLSARVSNHRHTICTNCWEIGRPIDELPSRNPMSGIPYGTCCYCGQRTRCDITNIDLPDAPEYCYPENDTAPDDYHAICEKCYPSVTEQWGFHPIPILRGQYSIGNCCVCAGYQPSGGVAVYAVSSKGHTGRFGSAICSEVHFQKVLHAKRRSKKVGDTVFRLYRGLMTRIGR